MSPPLPPSALSVALASFLVCHSTLTAANTSQPPSSNTPSSNPLFEEVIVLGAKRDVDKSDYPTAASIIDGETIRTEQIRNIADIANSVPGLNVVDTGARNPDTVIIRGIHFDGIGSNDLGGDGSSVTTYVNSIPMQGYYSPPQIILKDLDRVEVLRGPQGTLFGASSLAGAVLYSTAAANLESNQLIIETQASTTDHASGINSDSAIIGNLALPQQNLALRGMISYEDKQGFIDNNELLAGPQRDINNERNRAARLSTQYQPTKTVNITGMWHSQKGKVGDRQADNIPYTGKAYEASSSYLQPSEAQLDIGELGLKVDLGKHWQLQTFVSHYDYQQDQTSDLTDWYQSYFLFPPEDSAIGNSSVKVKQDSLEVRASGSLGDKLNLLVGAFYAKNTLDAATIEYLNPITAHNTLVEYESNQEQTLRDTALFGEANWKVMQSTTLTLGARHFNYKDDATAWNSLDGQYGQTTDDSHTSFKIAGHHRFSAAFASYITLSEGFRRGGANPGVPNSAPEQQSYQPDSTLNTEWGLVLTPTTVPLKMEANLFYIQWDQIQLISYNDFTNSGFKQLYINNANDAQSSGIELSGDYVLTDSITLKAGYAYSDAKLSEDALNYDGGITSGYKNDRLPGSPKQQGYMRLQLQHSLYGKPWRNYLNVNYLGASHTQLNAEHSDYRTLTSYYSGNFLSELEFNRYQVGLFIQNLSNKRAVLGGRGETYYGNKGQFEYINTPRTVGLNIRYQLH